MKTYTYKCVECVEHELGDPETLVVEAATKREADVIARNTRDQFGDGWVLMKNAWANGWVGPLCADRVRGLLRRDRATGRRGGCEALEKLLRF